MTRIEEPPTTSLLAAVSNAMVALHKEQFGRGPTMARSHFAGTDALVCVLQDVLLPAERRVHRSGRSARRSKGAGVRQRDRRRRERRVRELPVRARFRGGASDGQRLTPESAYGAGS